MSLSLEVTILVKYVAMLVVTSLGEQLVPGANGHIAYRRESIFLLELSDSLFGASVINVALQAQRPVDLLNVVTVVHGSSGESLEPLERPGRGRSGHGSEFHNAISDLLGGSL